MQKSGGGWSLMLDKLSSLQMSIHFSVAFLQHIWRIRNCGSLVKQINGSNCLTNKNFLDRNLLPNYLKNKIFAPFENQFGLAELFVLDLLMYDFNLEGKMYLLNGYSEDAFTPKEIFSKT